MAQAITPRQVPRAFSPDKGRETVAVIHDLTPEQQTLVEGAAGCCPYLAGLAVKEADWIGPALQAPDDALRNVIADVMDWDRTDLAPRLRQAKRRVALLTALADLAGVWPLSDVTRVLSDFAQTATTAALRQAVATQIRRGKLPGATEEDMESAGGMCVLAMGKLGAFELNYSSDIDLICLFDETRFEATDFHDARAAFVRATRAMCATLSEITAEGYVFRTDLRLRPDPSVTPVCMAMEAAERYYESVGRTWERAAYIKARPLAGDIAAGDRFLEELRPFVWRKHLDFAAIQDAHDMRLAIRAHKGTGGPITLPGHNMKLGRGGIREIEFFTQTRQLIAGGRDTALRCRGTVEGLAVLARQGWIDEAAFETLQSHYVFHRTVEHRLQMVQDAQTHSLPKTDEGFDRLAAMMDRETGDLKNEIAARLNEVHSLTEGFFAPSQSTANEDIELSSDILARWMSYPALRSERSRALFARLQPELMRRLGEAGTTDAALRAFDGFLSGLPAGVQLFSLLEANRSLLDLLIDIVSSSPALAEHLSRNANVLDAVIGGDFFTDWPGCDGLSALLGGQVARAGDYEEQLNIARRFTKEWHFRIGVHLLRGLTKPVEAARQYSDLARANLRVLWPVVIDMFAEKHGRPPGRGAVLLGMGSLGAGTLTPTSDLDLIVVYDAAGVDASDGRKPMQTRPYYAKLTQALITALSAPTAEGRLYEVDMRLRPSGNQGPVATSLAAFETYQKDEAWLWEHLALVRACPVAGPNALAEDIEKLRREVLSLPHGLAEVCGELVKMRARIAAAKAPRNLLDVKTGAGRLQDIELLAQAGMLLDGGAQSSTASGLEAAEQVGLISGDDREFLSGAASYLAGLGIACRLLNPVVVAAEDLTPASQSFLARTFDAPDTAAIEAGLERLYADADAVISAALKRHLSKG